MSASSTRSTRGSRDLAVQVTFTFADGPTDQCDSGPVQFTDVR